MGAIPEPSSLFLHWNSEMSESTEELLDSIRATQACLKDVRELAGKLNHLSVAQIESLLLKYVEEGEDQAVSRLLQACAFNKVKLDKEAHLCPIHRCGYRGNYL